MQRISHCHCADHHLLHFDNDSCVRCGAPVGYLPSHHQLVSLIPEGHFLGTDNLPRWRLASDTGTTASAWDPGHGPALFKPCANRTQPARCNWLLADSDPGVFCPACRLNECIPDLSVPGNDERWWKIEHAKRRLVSVLLALDLPVHPRDTHPDTGLAFLFLQGSNAEPVQTGHLDGRITLDITEADDAVRERERVRLGEHQRTLLGHLRHEAGHRYWEVLVRDRGRDHDFRQQFGDWTTDYGQSLQRHYDQGPPPDWQDHYISAYASMHPWEDWAETWTHYLLMRDVLWTARDLDHCQPADPSAPRAAATNPTNLNIRARGAVPAESAPDFDALQTDWLRLSLTVNTINRAAGLADLYPFVLTPLVRAKLAWVHNLIRPLRPLRGVTGNG